jgi:hypothetical protein
MDIPTIDPQDISQFHSLDGEVKALNEQASAAIEAANANSENELTTRATAKPLSSRKATCGPRYGTSERRAMPGTPASGVMD